MSTKKVGQDIRTGRTSSSVKEREQRFGIGGRHVETNGVRTQGGTRQACQQWVSNHHAD